MEKKFFLVNSFEEFHKILFDYRKKIIESYLFINVEDINDKNILVAGIQREFVDFIKNKSSKIFAEAGIIGESIFNEISYAMVALADEIFLCLDWEGQKYWQNNLLERKMFDSSIAGEKIYEKIEENLSENSIESNEIALIYFYCLALGFKGGWRDFSDCEERIKKLKEKLYFKIYYKDSKFFKEKNDLFPQAYSCLYKEDKLKLNNHLNYWKYIALILIAGYIIVAEILWDYNLSGLINYLQEFIKNFSGV